MLAGLKKHQFLFEELVKRDFKKKYKRTILGMGWNVLMPLLALLVMKVVFFLFCAVDHVAFTWRFVFLLYPILTLLVFNIGIGRARSRAKWHNSLVGDALGVARFRSDRVPERCVHVQALQSEVPVLCLA